VAPAVREAVGRDVDDAHDEWTVKRQTGNGLAPPAHALEQLRRSDTKRVGGHNAPANLAAIALDQLGGGEQEIAAARHGKCRHGGSRRDARHRPNINALIRHLSSGHPAPGRWASWLRSADARGP